MKNDALSSKLKIQYIFNKVLCHCFKNHTDLAPGGSIVNNKYLHNIFQEQ